MMRQHLFLQNRRMLDAFRSRDVAAQKKPDSTIDYQDIDELSTSSVELDRDHGTSSIVASTVATTQALSVGSTLMVANGASEEFADKSWISRSGSGFGSSSSLLTALGPPPLAPGAPSLVQNRFTQGVCESPRSARRLSLVAVRMQRTVRVICVCHVSWGSL